MINPRSKRNLLPASKPKSVDLGQLQDAFVAARRAFILDAKALERAQEVADRSKAAFAVASDALKAATRLVLA